MMNVAAQNSYSGCDEQPESETKKLCQPATAVRHPSEIRKVHRADVSKSEIGRTSVR